MNFAVATSVPQGVSVVETTPPKHVALGATEEFVLKMKFNNEGTYTTTIQLIINEELILDGPLEVQVSPAPFPWALAILAIVAIMIVVLVVVLMRRRRAPTPAPIVPTPYAPAQTTPLPSEATKYCTSCGSPMPQSARHCPKCGAGQG